MIIYILLAILMLGLIVTVHEFGHFISARIAGIPVKEFSVGFGPKLIGWKSKKHDTLFKISAIPMGGYCMFYGETASDPDAIKQGGELINEDDPRLFNKHSVWKRLFTVASGPLMNFILAIIVSIIMVSIFDGIVGLKASKIHEGTPAHIAGFMNNDQILSINGLDVNDGTTSGISKRIAELADPNKALEFAILRNNEKIVLKCTPTYNKADKRYLIGIDVMPIFGKLSTTRIIPTALNYCKNATGLIAGSIAKLLTTGEGFDQTAGPVGVIKLISSETKQNGLPMFLNLIVIISINLGLVNLLPIPGLDGARIIFMFIEALRGKPINQKVETYIHLAGYVLLFGLLIFLTFKDVLNIFK